MRITNLSEHEKEIPEVGFVEAGGTIDVPDDLGKSLCEQVDAWAAVTAKVKPKAD